MPKQRGQFNGIKVQLVQEASILTTLHFIKGELVPGWGCSLLHNQCQGAVLIKAHFIIAKKSFHCQQIFKFGRDQREDLHHALV